MAAGHNQMPDSIHKAIRFIGFLLLTGVLLAGLGRQLPAAAESRDGFREDGRLVFLDDDGKARAAIAIEIAATPAAKTKGLMGRARMDDTVGMLFVYDQDADQAFWMRNTIVSLDIIFVSADRRVINIAGHTEPYAETIYRSAAPARYVLEVVAGFCERHGIRPGTRLNWQLKETLK